MLSLPFTLIRLVALLGNHVLHAVAGFGRFCTFTRDVAAGLGHPKVWLRRERLGRQLFEVGTLSIPVLAITGAFIGMTLAFEGRRRRQPCRCRQQWAGGCRCNGCCRRCSWREWR